MKFSTHASLLFCTLLFIFFQLLPLKTQAASNPLNNVGLTAGTPSAAAYSIRLLSTSYTGPALRVRRSSDNQLRDVYFDGTGVISLNSQVSAAGGGAATATTLTSWLGANSGYVRIWYDQSGNARDLSQTTDANQPRIVNAGALDTKSSLPAIRHLASSSHYLSAATAYLSTNFWTLNVVEGLDGGSNQRMLSGAANWLIGFWNGNEQSYYYNGSASGSTYGSGVTATTNNQIYTAMGQGSANGVQYCNSVAFTNGSSAPSNPPTSIYTSSYGTTSEFSNGTMQELLVFSTTITATDRQTVECNQRSYYSISAVSASVGINQSMCGTLTSNGLGGNTPAAGGTGLWTQVSGPGTTMFSGSTSGNSTATASVVGTYVYKWTVTLTGCSASANITVAYAAGGTNPTATTSGSTTICPGSSANVSIALTGIPPWNLTYTDGSTFTNVTGIISSTYTFSVMPLTTTTYSASVLTDASCTALPGNLFGSAIITVTPPLSTSLSAAAAYSVRKLTSCYSGPAMRVRRSSDNELRDVYYNGSGDISLTSQVSAAGGGTATATTLTTWLGANSGYVRIWYDQSGNGRDMSQTTNGNQPRIVNAGALDTKSSVAAIRHIAANSHYLSASTSYLSTNYWTVTVIEGLDGGANQRMLSGTTNWLLGFWNANEQSVYFNTGGLYSSGVTPTTNNQAYMAIGQGSSNALLYRNGVSFTATGAAPSSPPGTIYTGSWAGTSEFSNGTMQELLIYTNSISATDKQTIETSQSNYYSGLGSLPIDLIYFNCNKLISGKIELSWATATETNNDFFTIERSINGLDYTLVGTIDGAGNSPQTLYYKLEDDKPLTGVNYYRLKQTDFDGKYKYFELCITNNISSSDIFIYPNPSNPNDGFYIDLNSVSAGENLLVQIHDMVGKEIYSKSTISNLSNTTILVNNIKELKTGIFILSILSHSGTITYKQKLVVE